MDQIIGVYFDQSYSSAKSAMIKEYIQHILAENVHINCPVKIIVL